MSAYTRSLTFWRDLTPFPHPMTVPTESSPHVLVIGGGITGLSNAWVLLDKGYRVTVVSKEWASFGDSQRLTSQIAGALWEYPPAVCGQHTDKISIGRSKKWCMVSYDIWRAMAEQPELGRKVGVKMCASDFYFPNPVDSDALQLGKMKGIMGSGVVGFRRGVNLIKERRVDPAEGGVDAYEIQAPVIDTDQSMAWLMKLVKSKGGKLVTDEITQDLVEIEGELMKQYDAQAIINCSGLSGATLAGDDSCYPIRGALIRVVNDGKDFPKVTASLTISADAANDGEIVFIVPRSDDILILGGVTEAQEWDLDLTMESPVIKRMKERCEKFLPDLKKAKLDAEYPLAQGLRPFRSKNIRVEREGRKSPSTGLKSKVVHNYGHGGSGWTLSFGCAGEVVDLVEGVVKGREEKWKTAPDSIPAVPLSVRNDNSSSWETFGVALDDECPRKVAVSPIKPDRATRLPGK